MASENPAIVMPTVNWYVPGPDRSEHFGVPESGQRAVARFSLTILVGQERQTHRVCRLAGQRYLLSTTLGVTRGRGNTVEEVLSYLRRSVAADGTRPRGTIYFMWNRDVRSAVRDKCYASMAEQINQAGGRATVRQGRLPDGAKDVAGLMVGHGVVRSGRLWPPILPGAICEHLTSAGGVMTAGAHQTPLSEFLRHGAAGPAAR